LLERQLVTEKSSLTF